MAWCAQLEAQLAARHAREVAPFDVVDAYVTSTKQNHTLRDQLAGVRRERDRLLEENRRMEAKNKELEKAAQGLSLYTAKQRDLEEQLAALGKQLREAAEKANRLDGVEAQLTDTATKLDEMTTAKETADVLITQLTSNLTEQSNTNTVLKRENEALQTENAMQRQQFAKEKEENERLVPAIMMAKKNEAELRNQLMELEQQLLARQGSTASAAALPQPPREVTYTDPTVAPQTTCVAPTYVAHCTDDAHTGDIHAVAMTENGRHVWTGGADKTVKGWDGNNGAPAGRFATAASTVCLDSKANYLVAGCTDFSCRVFHLPTMRTHSQLTGHTEAVTAAYIAPDAQQVFTASRDCTIKAWDLQRGALQHTSLCVSSCYDLSVSVDRVCTAHFDNSIRLWDVRTGKISGEVRELHDRAVTSVRFAPDGHSCVTLSRDNTVKVVDLRTLQAVTTFDDSRFSINSNLARMTISPDGAFCAAGTAAGHVAIFNVRDPSQPVRMLNKGHTGAVTAVCWSPDGRGVASVGLDKRVIFWR